MSVTFYPATRDWDLFDEDKAPSVNLNNRNAADVLALLGLPHDFDEGLSGVVHGSDFYGRVLIATALKDTATDDVQGLPAVVDAQPGRATWVEGGRSPGYFVERLDQLREIAVWAAERDAMVAWA